MGIVTGIGDKSLNKNVIVPKIDADLNDYILNKNCIINGLEVIGNTLTAGMCVLKGYRGMLKNAETLNNKTYIYGKFTLYFNDEITDSFDILKTNSVPQDGTINPASINQAGIYYLLLYTYTNGAYVLNSELNTPTYPAHAYEADETDLVKSGAVIESGVTTPTPLDTNAHLTEPLRVANTEYVHNQIEEEVGYLRNQINEEIDIASGGGSTKLHLVLDIKIKSKYVLFKSSIDFGTGAGRYSLSSNQILKTLSSKFKPTTNIILCKIDNGLSTADIAINTNAQIVCLSAITGIKEQSDVYNNVPKYQETGYLGYETN